MLMGLLVVFFAESVQTDSVKVREAYRLKSNDDEVKRVQQMNCYC